MNKKNLTTWLKNLPEEKLNHMDAEMVLDTLKNGSLPIINERLNDESISLWSVDINHSRLEMFFDLGSMKFVILVFGPDIENRYTDSAVAKAKVYESKDKEQATYQYDMILLDMLKYWNKNESAKPV